MAMIAVQIVLERLAALVAEEIKLLGGVRDAVDELRNALESMKSFLHDAELRAETDQGVETWVKQVRDLAYETEDVLEDFFLSQDRPATFRNYIPKLKARHRLANKVQKIKLRIRTISDAKNAFSFDVTTSSRGTTATTWEKLHDPRLASLYLDESDVVGIENPKSQLITWLVDGKPELTSACVVGMGGLGKTTLVKQVFDSQPTRRSFQCYSWVTVSKVFTPEDLLRAALRGFLEATNEPVPEGLESLTDIELIHKLRNHLQEKRYVIVFDDVWSIHAWDVVKYALPDCKCGSRIIFTTRLSSFAASVENMRHLYNLQPLPEHEAWTLFCSKAFRGEYKGICPKELEKISQSILNKCEGLPLAIVAIGGLLSKKNKVIMEWKRVLERIGEELKSGNKLGTLGRILLLSYDDLPYQLKPCYLYLSVFPEDYLIKRMKLIRLWVIERFVQEKHGLTVEEVAEDYLNELVSRNLIQAVDMDYSNRVKTCRIHDLMREIIQQKSRDESLVVTLNGNVMLQNQKVRRLSIHYDSDGIPAVNANQYVRSLLFFRSIGGWHTLSTPLFDSFKLLRLLEVEHSGLSVFPIELVELTHLRYLSLRKTKISELPEAIGKLKYLEILDLKFSGVTSMPNAILQLKHLCQLRNYRYHSGSSIVFSASRGMSVPKGIGKLTSLQKLGHVEVVDEDGSLVREMAQLTELRRLGILKLTEKHETDLCVTLERLRHLTAVYMDTSETDVLLNLNSVSSPPPNLQKMYLKCKLPILPKWIHHLQFLAKIVLQHSNLASDPLLALQWMPSLVELELRDAYSGEELLSVAGGYPNLKKLSLSKMEELSSVRVEVGAMPKLRRLDIKWCRKLNRAPFGIEHLKNLEDMLLLHMPWGFLNTIKLSSGEDFVRVRHIRTITYVYESRGRWVAETLQ
ncbi:disease resistance protein RPM1-like [Rutidosis leptorrhynchoides]|uniref:disease resistance protein RPM1-like n=1 Tax=Rutidosis leptorrhynchoides TaxID=125765 RepID=UPI003A98EE6D